MLKHHVTPDRFAQLGMGSGSKNLHTSNIIELEIDEIYRFPYLISTFFNAIFSVLSLIVVSWLFTQTDINAYEVVYFKCGAIVFSIFLYSLFKGVYILDVEPEKRNIVLVKSFVSYAGIVFFYLSI